MPVDEQLSHLERLAQRLGISVRYEPFSEQALGARGGLCRVHGELVFLADRGLAPIEKVTLLARTLSMFDVEALFVPPLLRNLMRASA